MTAVKFHRAMKAHCTAAEVDCENCCMRLYCYTPPCERTEGMMEMVMEFLNQDNLRNRSVPDEGSDHHTAAHQMPCPCNLDMSSALGCESR